MRYKYYAGIYLAFVSVMVIELIIYYTFISIYNTYISSIIYNYTMRFRAWFAALLLLLLPPGSSDDPIKNTSITVSTTVYNSAHLYNGVLLSAAAYCGKDRYMNMSLNMSITGFVVSDVIYDPKTDLQGYVGFLPSAESIYVAFRGSSSILNWIDDFEVRLVPYTTAPECNCTVHSGFYRSALGVRNKTIDAVSRLLTQYPAYSVIMTGHSYGASVTQMLAMELARAGIKPAIYNYGQPRTGDARYAAYVPTIISEYYRTTHDRDIVPHVPPTVVLGYLHSTREIFERVDGNLTLCSATTGEDPECADQYSIEQTNGTDHSYYLGHYMSC